MASGSGIKHKMSAAVSPTERGDVITSRENKWIKLFRAALRGTGPSGDGLIGIEGPKLVEEALRSGLEADALLVSATGEQHLPQILMAASASDAGIRRERIFKTTDQLFAGCAGTETPQGVAALFHQPQWNPEDVLRGRPAADGARSAEEPLVLVMTGVQDPGNVGTILRSAEAFGATGAVMTRGTADPWSPKAVRASAGSALRLPLMRGMAIPVLLAQLKMHEVQIVAASLHAGTNHSQRDRDALTVLRGPAAIFIGSEGTGLPPEIEHAADATISIPMSESVESLNAAIAASVLLYEAARQRKEIS
ncbi:MAG TPA: RNA methyltransferase [Candidatus Acidoferrales bacterium]|jgi:TrmH family RNA methyltransferase|nr:RNA methyltransferase [Candidatus Acidoferrales bacterium]